MQRAGPEIVAEHISSMPADGVRLVERTAGWVMLGWMADAAAGRQPNMARTQTDEWADLVKNAFVEWDPNNVSMCLVP